MLYNFFTQGLNSLDPIQWHPALSKHLFMIMDSLLASMVSE